VSTNTRPLGDLEFVLQNDRQFALGFAAGRAYQSGKDVEAVALAMKDWSGVWCIADAALREAGKV